MYNIIKQKCKEDALPVCFLNANLGKCKKIVYRSKLTIIKTHYYLLTELLIKKKNKLDIEVVTSELKPHTRNLILAF